MYPIDDKASTHTCSQMPMAAPVKVVDTTDATYSSSFRWGMETSDLQQGMQVAMGGMGLKLRVPDSKSSALCSLA